MTDYTTCGALARMANHTSAVENTISLPLDETPPANTVKTEGFTKIYPNPATVEATIQYSLPSTTEKMTITIFNATGQVTGHETVDQPSMEGNYRVDISHYEGGIYFVKIVADGYESLSKLLVGK